MHMITVTIGGRTVVCAHHMPIDRAVRTLYWQDECRYISDTLDCAGGRVAEMGNSPRVFLNYCRLQRDQATLEGFHDSATYIQHCIDDLEARLKNNH